MRVGNWVVERRAQCPARKEISYALGRFKIRCQKDKDHEGECEDFIIVPQHLVGVSWIGESLRFHSGA